MKTRPDEGMRKAQIEFFTVVFSLRHRCLSKDSQELFRRSEIERLEWEQRRIEIQKQSLEVQRLKKRKRAEAEVQERALVIPSAGGL